MIEALRRYANDDNQPHINRGRIQELQMRKIRLMKRQMELEPLVRDIENDDTFPHHEKSLVLWNKLRDGILPYSGGWLEQPKWYSDDMSLIAVLKEYYDLERQIENTQDELDAEARKPK